MGIHQVLSNNTIMKKGKYCILSNFCLKKYDKQPADNKESTKLTNNKIYTASIYDSLVVFCSGKTSENSAKRICGHYSNKGKTFVLYEVPDISIFTK
jgi:hypothetical protein